MVRALTKIATDCPRKLGALKKRCRETLGKFNSGFGNPADVNWGSLVIVPPIRSRQYPRCLGFRCHGFYPARSVPICGKAENYRSCTRLLDTNQEYRYKESTTTVPVLYTSTFCTRYWCVLVSYPASP